MSQRTWEKDSKLISWGPRVSPDDVRGCCFPNAVVSPRGLSLHGRGLAASMASGALSMVTFFCMALLSQCFCNFSTEVPFTVLKGPRILDRCKQDISLKPHILS